jgi:hypothetical protein
MVVPSWPVWTGVTQGGANHDLVQAGADNSARTKLSSP